MSVSEKGKGISYPSCDPISPGADQLQKWPTSPGIKLALREFKDNAQLYPPFTMKFPRLFLISTAFLVAATLPAQAAHYRSTNGTTILNLNEWQS